MLVLSRKTGETILIGNDTRVTVVAICGNRVRLGIDAPSVDKITRGDVADEEQIEAVDAALAADRAWREGAQA